MRLAGLGLQYGVCGELVGEGGGGVSVCRRTSHFESLVHRQRSGRAHAITTSQCQLVSSLECEKQLTALGCDHFK